MVIAVREVYALVDHTKWGRTASATFCRNDRLTGIITDEDAPAGMVETLRGLGIAITRVSARSDR